MLNFDKMLSEIRERFQKMNISFAKFVAKFYEKIFPEMSETEWIIHY